MFSFCVGEYEENEESVGYSAKDTFQQRAVLQAKSVNVGFRVD